MGRLYFNSETSKSIRYEISTVKDLSDFSSQEDVKWEEISVAGQPAKLLVTSSGERVLFWKNNTEDFNAMLETEDETVDLTAMAESVAPGGALEGSPSYLAPCSSIVIPSFGTSPFSRGNGASAWEWFFFL